MKFKVKPTMRENWRYIAFELISEAKPVSEKDITRAILNSLIRLLGEVGSSKTNIWLLEYSEGKGLIRCSHTAVTEVMAAITTITTVNDKKAAVHVLGVSGTIKKAKEKWLNLKKSKAR
jgi:ribonuclease P/MRP protein subunit POP5